MHFPVVEESTTKVPFAIKAFDEIDAFQKRVTNFAIGVIVHSLTFILSPLGHHFYFYFFCVGGS